MSSTVKPVATTETVDPAKKSAAAKKAAATRKAGAAAKSTKTTAPVKTAPVAKKSTIPSWVWWLLGGLVAFAGFLFVTLLVGFLTWRMVSATPETPPVGLGSVPPVSAAAPAAPVIAATPIVDPRSTPVSPALFTSCGTWNTASGATNWLVPGSTARGDVKANGLIFYDSGVGEGMSVINNSSKPIEVYSEWGSGCEATTDLKFLVNKDLSDGCGVDPKTGNGCKAEKIVIFEDGKTPEPKVYTTPIQ